MKVGPEQRWCSAKMHQKYWVTEAGFLSGYASIGRMDPVRPVHRSTITDQNLCEVRRGHEFICLTSAGASRDKGEMRSSD